MTQSTIEKQGMKFDGDIFELFGAKGCIRDGKWFMNVALGAFQEVDRNPVEPQLIDLINTDIADGNFEKIYCVQVSPNFGVCLFLEGFIATEMMERSRSFGGTIIFESVKIGNWENPFILIVNPKSEHTCCTMDASGNIV